MEEWVTKIVAEKKSNRRFWFFWRDFRHPSRVLRWLRWGGGVCGWLGNENRDQKNQTDIFDFFGCEFRRPVSSHRNRRTLEFAILRLCPTCLRIKNFQKCLTKMQYSESESPAIVKDGEGVWMPKIPAKKNRRRRSRLAFLWHLPPFSQTRWRTRSTSFDAIKPLGLSSTLDLLSCSTGPLSQVAPPIWLGNL